MKKKSELIRVLQVIDKFATRGSPINGATSVLLNWFPAFRNTGIELSLCVLRGRDGGCEAFSKIGVNFQDLNRGKYDLRTILDLNKIIKHEKIDLLHCHQYGSSTMGRIAGLLTKTPVLVQEHMVVADLPLFLKLIDKLLAPCTTRGIAISNAVKQAMIDYRSINKEIIEIVYNTVPGHWCNKVSDKRKNIVYKNHHIPEGVILIGIVGRLDPIKGHTDFLASASVILKQHPHVYFLIVGEGELKGSLQQQVKDLEIEQQVTFLGNCDDVMEIISICDILVTASYSEGLCMSIEEAMAQGRAIVATAVGGIPELIIDGQSGMLVPANNPIKLAETITRLIEDKKLRTELGQNAQKRIKEKFLIQHSIDELSRIYQEVLGQNENHSGKTLHEEVLHELNPLNSGRYQAKDH
jgi:glycosyltransferase involved in cell wall biosynthesis